MKEEGMKEGRNERMNRWMDAWSIENAPGGSQVLWCFASCSVQQPLEPASRESWPKCELSLLLMQPAP